MGNVVTDSEQMSEAAFLEWYAEVERSHFPRSEHTVDVALFMIRAGELSVLLVRRGEHPDKGKWALPGGFVRLGDGNYGEGEELEDAAHRELTAKTGLEVFPGYLEQLRTYGSPWRDRRGRVFSTAYVRMMPNLQSPRGAGDATDSHFFAVSDLDAVDGPRLAFDHSEIVGDALERVRGKIEYEGRLAASFLAQPFTIPELRRVYEAVWGGPVHRGDFRRKVLSVDGFLVATGERNTETGGPPADLYQLGPATQFHPPMLREAMLTDKRADDA
jgi:8-oxo-dGTP diphosphatase